MTWGPHAFRADIHGLRAFAILAVVAYHLAPTVVPGGFIGVDVFFVLSGYLITGLILRDIREQRFSLLEFYARRCRRIVPALVVVLIAVGVLGWFTLLPDEFANLGRNILAGGTFTSNVLLKHEANYFDVDARFKPLLHLWSLGIEEQFYLFWPLALLLIMPQRRALPIAGVLFALSLTAHLMHSRTYSDAAFYLIHYRFWELLAGALLVMVQARFPERVSLSYRSRSFIASGALSMLVICTLTLDRLTPWLGGWLLLPIAATVMLIAVGSAHQVTRLLLGTRPAQFVGSISYPLYLWHWPLLSLLNEFEFGHATPGMQLAAAAAAFVLAWLTWRYAERPIQQRLTPLTGWRARQTVITAVATLTTCALLGAGIQAQGGFAGRFPAPLQTTIQEAGFSRAAWKAQWDKHARCRDRLSQAHALDWCYTDPDQNPTVALWGDSHAAHLYDGLHDLYRKRGESLLVLAQASCAPLLGVLTSWNGHTDKCIEKNNAALDLIRQSPSIHTVILSFRASQYVHGRGLGEHGLFDTLAFQNAESAMPLSHVQGLELGLSRTLAALETLGKPVILVMQVPELGFEPSLCLPRPILASYARACTIRRDQAQTWQAGDRRLIVDLQSSHPQLRVFDPFPAFCDKQFCRAEEHGRILYRDNCHLNRAGSAFVATQFGRWLDKGRNKSSP